MTQVEFNLQDRSLAVPAVRRVGVVICLLLALLSMAVYANSLKNGFALDDVAIVQHNEHVTSLEWTAIWRDNYWTSKDGLPPDILYRPLTLWSYLATQAIWPDVAWPQHLGNVLLHGLATVLGVLLAWRIFANRGVAILTGLLFAVHPLHAEVVANVVGRAELLSTIFTLLAILVYLPDAPLMQERGPTKRSYWHGLLVAACFILAMFSKETPVALLGGFVGIDLWRWMQWDKAQRPTLDKWFGRQTVRYYLPLVVVFGIYLAMRINACGLMRNVENIHPIVNPLVRATAAERLVTPFALFAKYLALTFWPAVLSADYSFPSIKPGANPLAAMPLIGILLTVLAGISCVKLWRKAPQVVLTIGLFACSYALVSNFLRIGTILGERLFYLPSLFVLMLVAAAAIKLYRETAALRKPVVVRWAAASLVAIGCIAMSWRTYVRNTDWDDNITLAIATARDNPMSAKACYWAGSTLAMDATTDKLKEFGTELLQRAIELYPGYGLSYFELAKYEGRKQHLAKSVIFLAQAGEFGPGVQDIRIGLTEVKKDLQRAAPDQYMPELLENERLHPQDPAAKLALGVAYAAQQKYDLADQSCMEAMAMDNHFHEAACELGQIRLKSGHQEAGINVLKQYVQHVGITVESRCLLASAYLDADTRKVPDALIEAKHWLDEADAIQSGSSRVRELRGALTRKLAAAHVLAEATGVSMAPVGGAR